MLTGVSKSSTRGSFCAAILSPSRRCWPSTTLKGPTSAVSISIVLLASSNASVLSVANKDRRWEKSIVAVLTFDYVIRQFFGARRIEHALITLRVGIIWIERF